MIAWHNSYTTTEKGVIGTVTSIGSSVVSMLPHLEATLRIGGLIIGILVGVATLVSVLHDIMKKRKELKK
jgi:DMSO reductase anchor subunit